MNARSFFAELKRRNVYKVAVAYGAVAWLLIQAASILFPHLRSASVGVEGVRDGDRIWLSRCARPGMGVRADAGRDQAHRRSPALDDALSEIKRAQELDPLSPIISVNVAVIALLKNDIDAAIEQSQRIIELDPNHQLGHEWLGWAYFKQRRYPEAIAGVEKAAGLSGRSSPQLGNLGCVYAVAGRRAEALGILKELEERYARREAIGQHLAGIYASLGENERAFAWLEKDFAKRSGFLPSITWRPQFEQLRRDPRGIDLIRRMGLNP